MTILDDILADKRVEVERAKREVPVASLQERIRSRRPSLDFASAIRGDRLRLIAEVKCASPSRGLLRPDFDPVALARAYAENGAAAISVLTEVKHFQGSLEYLMAIRRAVAVPLLRKDFIYDEYQVDESAACGADAILLIVAILEPAQLEMLMVRARELGLACLVEVHNEIEMMTALLAGAEIIGINNRDLNTFKVDTSTTRRLRLLVPTDTIVVSESGIHDRDDIRKMKECRVDAVLVGEALVTAPDLAMKITELLS